MPGASTRGGLAAAWLVFGAGPALAQSLSVSVNPVVIPPPTEVQYDAAPPANVTSATSLTMTLDCPNVPSNAGCQIDWAYSGASLQLEYQVTAATGCNAGFTTASFAAVPSVTTRLVDAKKVHTCTLTVLLRVRGLAYDIHQAGTTYLQGLTLTAKRQ